MSSAHGAVGRPPCASSSVSMAPSSAERGSSFESWAKLECAREERARGAVVVAGEGRPRGHLVQGRRRLVEQIGDAPQRDLAMGRIGARRRQLRARQREQRGELCGSRAVGTGGARRFATWATSGGGPDEIGGRALERGGEREARTDLGFGVVGLLGGDQHLEAGRDSTARAVPTLGRDDRGGGVGLARGAAEGRALDLSGGVGAEALEGAEGLLLRLGRDVAVGPQDLQEECGAREARARRCRAEQLGEELRRRGRRRSGSRAVDGALERAERGRGRTPRVDAGAARVVFALGEEALHRRAGAAKARPGRRTRARRGPRGWLRCHPSWQRGKPPRCATRRAARGSLRCATARGTPRPRRWDRLR